MPYLVLLATACTVPAPTSPSPEPCELVEGPTPRRPDSQSVRLVQLVDLALSQRAEVSWVVDGQPRGTSELAIAHRLPVLGLRPGVPHDLELSWICADGGTGEAGPVRLEAEPLDGWPEVEVLTPADARATLLPIRRPDGTSTLAIVDESGQPLWAWVSSERVVDARLEPDGTVWAVVGGQVLRLDLLGHELGRWSSELDEDPAGIVVPGVGPFHHEVVPTADGFLSLAYWPVDVDAYPVDADDPLGATAPATLEDTLVVEIGRDGAVLARHSLAAELDTSRISWSSLGDSRGGYDWAHANGVAIDPVDGDLVVSLRHQDAVVALDRETGALEWILSTPEGWREPWASARLAPVGPVSWPFHAHAPLPTAEGTLLLFDNGNHERTTPYSPPGSEAGRYSRMVEYAIDEHAGTVRQVWEAVDTTQGPLFSPTFGDADRLADGHRLGVWGDVGRGEVHLVEVAPDGTVAWEIRLRGGFTVSRAQRLDRWP